MGKGPCKMFAVIIYHQFIDVILGFKFTNNGEE